VDETLGAWLQAKDCNHLPLETYLRTDDVLLLYHLQRWQFDDDQLLGDLCRRYNDRDLLKAANVSQWSSAEQQSKLAQVKKAIAALGWDPEVYGGLCYSQSRGYTLYQQGILVRLETCLQDLSEISPLVQTLSRQQRQTWLIYPREVEAIVERLT
jgi:HD superfamily phosphohydrolase